MNDIRKSKQPFILTVCQQKGGVGKTTTCASLGAELANIGKKSLMIDLAPSGNLSSAFGFDLNNLDFTTTNLFHETAPLSNLIHPTSIQDLKLIPANISLSPVPRELYQKENYEIVLHQIFEQQDFSEYDFLILDCPPGMDSITVNAIATADWVILPVECEYLALQTLENMFRLITLTRERINPKIIYHLLVTKMDQKSSLHQQVYAQIKDHYPDALLKAIIEVDHKFPESQIAGVPTYIYDPKSQGSKQYRALTREMLDLIRVEDNSAIEDQEHLIFNRE